MWIGLNGAGAARFDRSSPELQHVGGKGSPMEGTDPDTIGSTADGSTWFGTAGDGLYRLERSGRWTHFGTAEGAAAKLPSDLIYSLVEDRQGGFWVGTSAGLLRWTGRSFVAEPVGRDGSTVIVMLRSDAEGLWIGTTEGLYFRDRQGRVQAPTWTSILPNRLVFDTLLDQHGTRWLTTRGGLVRVRGDSVSVVSTGNTRGFGFGKSLLEDAEGGLWIVQRGVGLLRLPARWRNFASFPEGDDAASLSTPWARAVAPASNGGVWIAGVGWRS
jgi:ligand-binding sensor domain-containing protein